MYWASKSLVLGGVAFENFEVRQRFIQGQTSIFGITHQDPWVFYHGVLALPAPMDVQQAPAAIHP
jgi:hypothetical protein